MEERMTNNPKAGQVLNLPGKQVDQETGEITVTVDEQLSLFDGQEVSLIENKLKNSDLIMFDEGKIYTPELMLGEKIFLMCVAKVVKVSAGHDKHGLLVRSQSLEVIDAKYDGLA